MFLQNVPNYVLVYYQTVFDRGNILHISLLSLSSIVQIFSNVYFFRPIVFL